jgi:glycosyltransferase involved in cell wall biosynthesis
VLRAFAADATVCYLGIDTSRFFPNGEKEDFVLSVGEFAWHKNPLFVIRAVSFSRRQPKLVWVANHVDERCFRAASELANQLGVNIDVKQSVSEAELVRFYQRASLFLYAPRLEPFGLAALEASSCGTPVIAVAEGGVRETVAHLETGVVVESDPKAMACAIDMLLDDAAKAKQLGENGARHVRLHWSDQSAVDRIERALESVIATR